MDAKANGLKIHYVQEGEGSAVVFAHGFVMDHTMFAAQFEELPDRFRCIAWDMRGHGHSDCPPGPWSMQDSVDDMIAFIEATNVAPCHLVGMSWGGMIAMRVGIQRPDLVRSLVLIDTNADTDTPEFLELERGFQATVEQEGITDDIVQAGLALLFGERYRDAEPEAMGFHFDRIASMKPEALVEGLRALMERDSVVTRLDEIKVPVLVVHGEEDASIAMAEAEKIVSSIGSAKLVRIPGAGHTTPIEAPDEVNAALAGFLAG